MAEVQQINPKKCGIRLNPPSLILYYEETISGRMRKRVMPIRHLNQMSDVGSLVAGLKEKNAQYLSSVPDVKLEKLIRIIQETSRDVSLSDAIAKVEKEFHVDPEEDLNKLDSESLERKKSVMNETFEANRKKPGDPDFQYDVAVNFGQDTIESSGWDSDLEDRIL